MKLGKKTIKFLQHYWRQSPAEVRRRLERGTYQAYREKRSKELAITERKKERYTRKYVDWYKKQNEPRLMRLSYDLQKGAGTRESPSLVFEFQFFMDVGRLDAEKWTNGSTVQEIRDEALNIFQRIADRYSLSGGMQEWIALTLIPESERRYAEAEIRDKNFIRLEDNRGWKTPNVRKYVDY